MSKWQWTEEQKHFFALSIEEKVKIFWSRVDRSGGPDACWEWQGRTDKKGYGRFFSCLGENAAYRIAYRLTRGDIAPGLCLLHSCDNPPCCNPNHLSQGTLMDNMRDKITKGRHWRGGNIKKQYHDLPEDD